METAHLPLAPSGELMAKIMGLDLTMPLAKVMDPEEGYGWDAETARRNERDYKRFLYLTVTSTIAIVPTKSIDKMWHAHILDTRKYADDCEQIFGGFLHHFPYFGIRGEDDAKNLASAFAETKRVWAETFGDTVFAEGTGCTGGECSVSCGACQAVIKAEFGEVRDDAAPLSEDAISMTGMFRDAFARALPPALEVF